MITAKEQERARQRAAKMLAQAGIVLRAEEATGMEVADMGLGDLASIGLQIVTYINNDRYCAKELVLFPRQTCPEHRHPAAEGRPGKRETFRCRWGRVWLYVEGPRSPVCHARIPAGRERAFTVFHEIELTPGSQYTLEPDTLHWFQANDAGAIVSEFSSTSRDEGDVFTDAAIKRAPEIG